MSKLIFLEFNEINFDFIEEYAETHSFPNVRRFIDAHGLCKTTSEHEFHKLEPWIQWVTAHTGLDADSHGVFRLGDIVDTNIPQIWETLEREHNLKVGAISPMNARNATENPAFFLPDPWTKTPVKGSWDLQHLSHAVNEFVNENAHRRTPKSALLSLALGGLFNFRVSSVGTYLRLVSDIRSKSWAKALVLDRLLADTLITQWKKHKPDFTTLFMNAGAHIQHHYMYESGCYKGDRKAINRHLRVPEGCDPLLEVYQLYDRILGDVQKAAPDARIMFGTGLSQLPNPRLVHYYRPLDHKTLLRRLGVPFSDVLPRMSRDFLVVCDSAEAGTRAEAQLRSVTSADGKPIFSVDNRGDELFCMLSYTDRIGPGFRAVYNGGQIDDLSQVVSLVTIENGIHRSIGFFSDSGVSKEQLPQKIALTQVFSRVLAAFDSRGSEQGSDSIAFQT